MRLVTRCRFYAPSTQVRATMRTIRIHCGSFADRHRRGVDHRSGGHLIASKVVVMANASRVVGFMSARLSSSVQVSRGEIGEVG